MEVFKSTKKDKEEAQKRLDKQADKGTNEEYYGELMRRHESEKRSRKVTMDYEEAWKETKKFIEGGIDYMNLQIEIQIEMSSNGTIECKRLMSKREGFEVIKQYMHNSEKIYKG